MARQKKKVEPIKITPDIFNKYTWDVVSLAIQANVPAILWGDPGIAKTSKMYVLAEQLGLPCEVVILSIREPSDFRKAGTAGRGADRVQDPLVFSLRRAGG